MKRKVSITQKHFIYFLLLYLVSITFLGSYSYYIAKKSILERTFNQLISVRNEKNKKIQSYLNDRIKESEYLANQIKSNYLNLEISKVIAENSFLLKNGNFKSIILIENDSLQPIDISIKSIIIDSLPKQVIDNKKLKNIYDESLSANQTILRDIFNKSLNSFDLLIAIPLTNSSKHKAIILFALNTNIFNKIMFENDLQSGLGKTGESYIVGRDFFMRTHSRFAQNKKESILVKTIATESAFSTSDSIANSNNSSKNIKIIKDYRKKDVLSSWSVMSLNGLFWAVITEIDAEEALQPINDLRNSIVIISIIMSIFIFGLVYLGSLRLTNPIIQLIEATKKLSKGDYNIEVNYSGNDEMLELIESFNYMATILKEQSEQINQHNLNRIKSVIDGQESERTRLSRDLHDGLGQMLLAVKNKLEQAKITQKENPNPHLNEAISILKNSISEIRIISNDLMPTVLSNFGLQEGIQRLCKDTQEQSNIKFSTNCSGFLSLNLNSKEQIYIYRIIQEVINNIIKHSAANSVVLQSSISENSLIITIEDNGDGFDIDNHSIGNGLINIKDRVELLNGKIDIFSERSKGTRIKINIPIQQNIKSNS